MLKSGGRAGDKYSISLFLPEYSFPQHFIFIRCYPLQLKIIPHRFYQIGPLNHLCSFFFLPPFRKFYTGMYMVVLKCMSSGHGTCSAAAGWDLLWVDARGSLIGLAMGGQETPETLISLSILTLISFMTLFPAGAVLYARHPGPSNLPSMSRVSPWHSDLAPEPVLVR